MVFFPTGSINYNFNCTHNDWPSSFLVLFLQYHGNNSDRLAMVLCSYGGCESVYMYTPMHWKKAAVYFSGPTVTANILAQLGSNPLNLRPMLQQTYHTACKFKNTT